MKIFTEAAKLVEKNCPFAMAEIIECSGSTPRHSAQMLVLGDGKNYRYHRRWYGGAQSD
ncbi:Uncharacterised protein [Morganella morganii]|nr:Uncharacterised protein [Morganella morganii]